jgi:sugar O-acyltransferase (sialic acid O-acetyltransferase NeuD family)
MNNLKKLFIVGASGMGREVFDYCRKQLDNNKEWSIYGFLDDNIHALDGFSGYPKVVGKTYEHVLKPDHLFVMAIGNGVARMKVALFLKSQGAAFLTLMDHDAIGYNTSVGEGCVIYPGSGVGQNCVLGDFVFLNTKADIGHDSILDAGVTLSAHVCVGGGVKLGKCAFVGSNATLLPFASIGEYSYVGAGSVVLRRVNKKTKVFGNPAVKIGVVEMDE